MGKEKQEYLIRLMRADDVKDVAAVEADAFPNPWPESIFAEEAENPLAIYLVLEQKNRVIGYAGFWLVIGEAQVTNIAILSPFRGKGLGRLLLKELVDKAKANKAEKIFLEVRCSNIVAQNLYKNFGFEKTGIRKGYYQESGEDALTMQKDLEKND